MNLARVVCSVLFLSAVALVGAPACAGDMVDNPKYGSWASFKPGSSSTMEADLNSPGGKFHLTMTRTLISVDSDKLVVETRTTVNILGHDQAEPPVREAILAKADKDQIKELGEKNVDAMGKTYKCKVFEAKGDSQNRTGRNTTPAEGAKATVYTNGEIPGGLVRLETTTPDGSPLTFILTGMKAE